MKKIMFAVAILFAASTVTFAQEKKSHAPMEHHKKQHKNMSAGKFTCPMHPEVVRSKPGKCPCCGMSLVPVKKKVGNGKRQNHMHS